MLKTAKRDEGLVVCVPGLLLASACVQGLNFWQMQLIKMFEGTQDLLQNLNTAKGKLRLTVLGEA